MALKPGTGAISRPVSPCANARWRGRRRSAVLADTIAQKHEHPLLVRRSAPVALDAARLGSPANGERGPGHPANLLHGCAAFLGVLY